MANFAAISGKLTLRMDTGEVKDGRAVYCNSYIGNVAASPDPDDVAAICDSMGDILQHALDKVTLTRVDTLEI